MGKQSPRNEEKVTKGENFKGRIIAFLFIVMFTTILLVNNDNTIAMEQSENEIQPNVTTISETMTTVETEVETEIEAEVETESETTEMKTTVETEVKANYKEEDVFSLETQIPSRGISEIVSEISPEMDISSTSGISKDDFIYAMDNCKYDQFGIIAENAEVIWTECQERELNEFAIVGIIAAESGWANKEKSPLTKEKNNVMSIKYNNGDYKQYDTYTDCILDGIRILDENYIEEDSRYATGGNLSDIGEVYATEEWSELVSNCAEMATRALTTEEQIEETEE